MKRHLAVDDLHVNRRNPPLVNRRVTLPRVKRAGDVTGLLQAWMRGDPDARRTGVAGALRAETDGEADAGRRAAACAWQPTDLINESHLRLLGWRDVEWKNRALLRRHGQDDAAGARRRRARGRRRSAARVKRPSQSTVSMSPRPTRSSMSSRSSALAELAALDPRPAQVVEMRFFGGFSVEETADALGVTTRTVINDWNTARAWLYERLSTQRTQ